MNLFIPGALVIAALWSVPSADPSAHAGPLAGPHAGPQDVRAGAPVTPVHRSMYERGLGFLVAQQKANGSFEDDAGVDGICVMALLASGEDPNFGRYAPVLRKAVRRLIQVQNSSTGLIGSGMYQHGFATLALADCYGALDETLLAGGGAPKRTIAEALELAVRCSLTSQNQNPFNAWRYGPSSKDADTSASGAILMGLIGARNAGIAVPDDAFARALEYFKIMTSADGSVGYSSVGSYGGSMARSAITALVFAASKRRDEEAFRKASEFVVSKAGGTQRQSHVCYTRYYVSQALFQVDHARWRQWSLENTKTLQAAQADNGRLTVPGGSRGPCYQTGMLLLSTALEFTVLPVYER